MRLEDQVEGNFGRRMEITFKSGKKVAAYYIGPVLHTGIGLHLLEDERQILITPEDALYSIQKGIEEKKAAYILFDVRQIMLTLILSNQQNMSREQILKEFYSDTQIIGI